MVEMQFYAQGKEKYSAAKIFLGEESKRGTNFKLTDAKIGGIPILKDSSKNEILEKLRDEENEITEIIKSKNAEIILAGSEKIVKRVIKNTREYELDVDVKVTERRNILYYAVSGIEPCVLLIAAE